MTVHGAKGLEAPVVILADATADPERLGRTPLTLDIEIAGRHRTAAAAEERGALPAVRGADRSTRKSATSRSIWRLLYVALTRAADRLIVSGVAPEPKKDGSDPRPPNSWHRSSSRRWRAGAVPADRRAWGTALVAGATGRTKREEGQGRAAADRGSGLGPRAGAARSAPAAPARALRHRRRRRGSAAAERGDARRGASRNADPPIARAPGGRRPGARHAAALKWLEQSAGVAEAAGASRNRRPGVRNSLRSAILRRCSERARWAKRRWRRPCRRASHRRHRRPPAGRGRARVGDRLQDRAGAGQHSQIPQRTVPRWRLTPRPFG